MKYRQLFSGSIMQKRHAGKSVVVMEEGDLSRVNDRYFPYSLERLIL